MIPFIVILVLFIVAYILYKNRQERYNKKHRPWATKEAHDRYLHERETEIQNKERIKQEEYKNAYAIHASKDVANEYSLIAEKFIANISSVDDYLKILTSINNPKHVKMHLSELNRKELGDFTHLYVKEYTLKESDIFEYLTVEDSAMGVWQAFLLYNISCILPTWQHANTMAIKYVFAYKDIEKPEILNALIDYHENLAPNIDKTAEGCYNISYCYWNDWLGLVKRNLEVILSNGKPTFNFLNNEILYKFNCGITY